VRLAVHRGGVVLRADQPRILAFSDRHA
jgi:hypothetical protein